MPDNEAHFATNRSRRWSTETMSDDFAKYIYNIEKFGCQIIQVKGTKVTQGWSYSFGVYDTSQQPEIVSVGLPQATALTAINKAARLLREGVDLAIGRHRDIVGEVECEFRLVDPKWVDHIMGRALWYYEDVPPPTLQLIYPDLENRFQWEPGFDNRFLQPLLQAEAIRSTKEEDFWALNDPSSSLFNWKFPDDPHTISYLSQSVDAGIEPVTYVSHDVDDGAWQFLGDSMAGDAEPVISCLHHPIDKDPTLTELADLPLGWWAEREAPGKPWVRNQHEPEDEETN